MNAAGAVASKRSTADVAGVDGPTRALIGLGLVCVLFAVMVGWLWWSDHRYRQVTVARQQALQSAREQAVTVLSDSTTRATLLAAGVVRAEPEQAVVLVFVNLARERSGAVQLSGHRIELTMSLVDGRWRVSGRQRV